MPEPAVFVDRDGTICEHIPYLSTPEEFTLLPTVPDGIRQLNESTIPVIVVTNQSGVGREYFDASAVQVVHDEMHEQLGDHSAHVDDVYFCPHHPGDGCSCRKPEPGMLLEAASDHDIDLERSYMIGDRQSDADSGAAVGCTTIVFPSEESETDLSATHIVDEFAEAVNIILDTLE